MTDPIVQTTATPAGKPSKSRYLALVAMLFAVAMTFIDQTIVSIASPNIREQLNLSQSGSQWVINSYLLALAAGFAFGGRLADVFGSRRMALIGIAGFALSSALCGATPHGSYAEAWIVGFRIVQGLSAALMVPAALAIVVSSFPINERGKALAIFFGVSGGLTAVGPILGGILTQWTWRAIFWVNLPFAVIAIGLTGIAHIQLKGTRERIDYVGAVLVAAGMALSVFGLEQAQTWGWSSIKTWLCIAGGLIILVAFVMIELRTRVPLLKLRIFKDRAFAVDNAVLFFSTIAFVPVFFFASVYAAISLGLDANNAGLYLLVFFAGFAPAAQVGGRILDKRGAKAPMLVGSALGIIGFGLWATHITTLEFSAQWWQIIIAGAGLGLIIGQASTDAVNRAIGASYGEVTGISQTMRNFGSALGLAVLGTVVADVFAAKLTKTFIGIGVPRADAASAAASAAASNGSGAGGQSSGLSAAAQKVLADGIPHDYALATRGVLIGFAVALAICFVLSLLHPGGKVESSQDAVGV